MDFNIIYIFSFLAVLVDQNPCFVSNLQKININKNISEENELNPYNLRFDYTRVKVKSRSHRVCHAGGRGR